MSDWRSRVATAKDALSVVRPGMTVFVGSACATPRTLVSTLQAMAADKPLDLTLVHFLTDGAIPVGAHGRSTWFTHKVFFAGTEAREVYSRGRIEYIPISLPSVHRLLEAGGLPLDVALIQVAPPDANGQCSLGVSVDIAPTAVFAARTVIAEVNPRMPRTLGDASIPVDRISAFVEVDTPVIEFTHERAGQVAEQVARYIARIIDDGSTLQVGTGRIPQEMLRFLTNRRDLGIHSDVITDSVLDLVEKGVVTGARKTLHPGQVIASFAMGTQRLYDALHENPMYGLYPIEYVADPHVIANNHAMVSVTQAFSIDLTGQVCSDQFGGQPYGGVGAQPEFLRGAANAPLGKPIVCLASTTEDGKTSRIRPLLPEGEAATIARSDVHWVVTEYGHAYLFGKSVRERALALLEIAHPSFRDGLLAEAKRIGYVNAKIALKSRRAYPTEEERDATLKDGTHVLVRPTKATDIEHMNRLFHAMTPEDVYTRFFTNLTSLSVSSAQHLCSVSYENEMAFVAVTGSMENEVAVASACSYLDPATNLANVAYMIRPDWQGKGLGALLHARLVEFAKAHGVRGFTADVLCQNEKMLKVFEKGGGTLTKKVVSGTYEVQILF